MPTATAYASAEEETLLESIGVDWDECWASWRTRLLPMWATELQCAWQWQCAV